MCDICDLAKGTQNPSIDRDKLMETAASLMLALYELQMEKSEEQFATMLISLIGMQDTLVNLLLQTGNPDGVPRMVNLMQANVSLLLALAEKVATRQNLR